MEETMKNAIFWDVVLVRTDASEELITIMVTIVELGTTLAITSN
jgi:hypothetical protein